jgi:hypothetical protein
MFLNQVTRNRMGTFALSIVFVSAGALIGSASNWAHADDTSSQDGSDQTTQPTKKSKKKAQSTADSSTVTEIVGTDNSSSSSSSSEVAQDNNRAKTLAGSKSPWSFQLNFSYSGSSIDHPLSEEAPNPGNQVPVPLVSFSGTISGRYRLDANTTVGLGIGLTTYQLFEGPKNTSLSNPYADIARTFKIGPFKSRADFQLGIYTDHQNSDIDGAILGPTLTDETYYTFGFGLTAGLFLEVDYNFFKSNPIGQYPTDQQTEWDFFTDPYFEYSLSKRVNLRSVIGIGSLHNNNQPGSWALFHPKIYQTFGVGVAALDSVFIYTFLQVPNYNDVSDKTVIFGFNTIINLF